MEEPVSEKDYDDEVESYFQPDPPESLSRWNENLAEHVEPFPAVVGPKDVTFTIHFLQIEGNQASFPFIAEKGTVNVELFKDSLGVSKAIGTTSNDDFMRYKDETRVYISSLNGIGNDLQQAMILKDSLLAQDLQEQYQDVQKKNYGC